MNTPLITNDAVVLGLLSLILGILFYLRQRPGFWQTFFRYVPIILMCYLVPSLLNTFGIISSESSNLWTIAKDYFLPACLILMTLSIDLKAIVGLGPKALIMFFTATVGIVIGGPVAVAVVAWLSPDTVGGEGADAVWRGLATVAGSWIGGGANQTAMLEVYGFNTERYSAMVAVDIIVANIWMAILLYGAGRSEAIDRWLGADSAPIQALQEKVSDYQQRTQRVTSGDDLMFLLGVAFGGVGLSHLVAGGMSSAMLALGLRDSILSSGFFWLVVTATTLGLLLSFTKARQLEGAGASKLGSVFIFLLVAIIGTKMDVKAVGEVPGLFVLGLIWMSFHSILLLIVARMIRAPFFFVAVGSKANVGGAASAPVVAAAFHPTLAPVGVLLAVLGYALGTYGAIVCAQMMAWVVT